MLRKVFILSSILCFTGILHAQISKPDAICSAANTNEVEQVRVIWRLGQLPYVIGKQQAVEVVEKEYGEEILSSHIDIEVFPNPSSDQINISFTSEQLEPVQILLFDNQGNTVKSTIEPLPIGTQTFDISDLANGIYYISIMEGKKVLAQSKVIKAN